MISRCLVIGWVCAAVGLTAQLPAQGWRPGSEVPLIVRAAEARAARDGGVASWRASASGLVRFASVVEHGDGPIERVIRADELRVEVYGDAPNRSKQEIVAWRDTSFLPNNVIYHRDHLGIVANDFGGAIRLGDGDEVRDVPHPLSAPGLAHYEFAAGDTLTISRPGASVRVVAFQVRPAVPSAPGTVGTLYLDLERAALVQFRFTFTSATYRDRTVADITVVLENAFLDGIAWLPWRQSIAIRRETPWLDLPIATMLRADWEIGDYELDVVHPATRFAGPSIAGLRRPGGDSIWSAPLAARLSGEGATTADRDAVARLAHEHLAQAGLSGLPGLRLSARGVSDFVHATRVQGVVVGLGASLERGPWTVRGQLGIGTADGRAVGSATVTRDLGVFDVEMTASRSMRDVGDDQIVSRAVNTLRTVVAGADLGDWTLVQEAFVRGRANYGATRIELSAGWQHGHSVRAAFTALDGTRRDNPSLGAEASGLVKAELRRLDPVGSGWRLAAEVGTGRAGWRRIQLSGRGVWEEGPGRMEWRLTGGAGSAGLPLYRSFVLGGWGTLPGVGFRAIGGDRAVTTELAWLFPLNVPTPPIPALVRAALPSRIGPYLAVGVAGGGDPQATRWRADGAVAASLGVRADLWGPLLRVDVGFSLRTGTVGVRLDAHPDWWPLL